MKKSLFLSFILISISMVASAEMVLTCRGEYALPISSTGKATVKFTLVKEEDSFLTANLSQSAPNVRFALSIYEDLEPVTGVTFTGYLKTDLSISLLIPNAQSHDLPVYVKRGTLRFGDQEVSVRCEEPILHERR